MQAWQVDMLLQGDRLFVHPKVTNPNAHVIHGYLLRRMSCLF